MKRFFRRTCAALMLLALPAAAEFSPLSTEPQGLGMPVAEMGARERGMGEGGMAAIGSQGLYLPNVSRSAYYQKTAFLATLEGDMDWVRDDASMSHIDGGLFPTLATLFKTRNFGTFGAYYQQAYSRKFEAVRPANGSDPEQRYQAEGGTFLLGASWGYAPVPWLAVGFSENLVLGRDRFIQSVAFSDSLAPPEAEGLPGDTLEMSRRGAYPSFSMTVRLPADVDVAASYTHSADLSTGRTRSTYGVLQNPLADTTFDLPAIYAVGAAWKPTKRQTVAADFSYEDWKGGNLVNPAYQVSAGYEFLGSTNPFDALWKRTTWRGGAGYKTLYLREVPELYATLGVGMPLGPHGHLLDLSLKYGHRSLDGNTFFAEDYVKLSASVVGVSVWGQPARKRR